MGNFNIITINFLDASALVKIVTKEPDAGPLLNYFPSKGSFHTNVMCVHEALGVLKVKWMYRKEITRKQYLESAQLLTAYELESTIRIVATSLNDSAVFHGAVQLACKHNIDISDALQLFILKNVFFRSFGGESTPILITADTDLAKVARTEDIRVWNCIQELQPTYLQNKSLAISL